MTVSVGRLVSHMTVSMGKASVAHSAVSMGRLVLFL